ncbi:MAG: hypothetical protein AAFY11_16355 [Cyanobacteria bacterium J06641_5]
MAASNGEGQTLVSPTPRSELFLACGLGSLGQHCAIALQEFGVRVVALDRIRPVVWELTFPVKSVGPNASPQAGHVA